MRVELRAIVRALALRLSLLGGYALRFGPGLIGAGLIAYGLGLIYGSLLYLAAGCWLLLIDRRIS